MLLHGWKIKEEEPLWLTRKWALGSPYAGRVTTDRRHNSRLTSCPRVKAETSSTLVTMTRITPATVDLSLCFFSMEIQFNGGQDIDKLE
jgi:hypothetical protein